MKTLLMMADDGVSALVWLEMAKQHLKAERTVFAITDDRNVYQAIGTGDGLPGYDCGLLGHPDFLTFAANDAHPDQVLEELRGLNKDVVVMFNLDPFELVDRYPGWQEVIDHCNAMPNDLVMGFYPPYSVWQYNLADLLEAPAWSAVKLLRSVDWDYVAGTRVLSETNLVGLRRCFPGLAHAIERPQSPRPGMSHDVFAWHVINRSGTFELRFSYRQFDEKTDAYPAMWDVLYPHVAPAPMSAQFDTRPHGVVVRSLLKLN